MSKELPRLKAGEYRYTHALGGERYDVFLKDRGFAKALARDALHRINAAISPACRGCEYRNDATESVKRNYNDDSLVIFKATCSAGVLACPDERATMTFSPRGLGKSWAHEILKGGPIYGKDMTMAIIDEVGTMAEKNWDDMHATLDEAPPKHEHVADAMRYADKGLSESALKDIKAKHAAMKERYRAEEAARKAAESEKYADFGGW